MNEDWLHKVHDRMTDYEIPEPENLWEAIESRRPEISPALHQPVRPAMIWVRRCIAVAAMIAVVITAGVWFFNADHQSPEAPLLTVTADDPALSPVATPPTPVDRHASSGPSNRGLMAQSRPSLPASAAESPAASAQTEIQTPAAVDQPAVAPRNPAQSAHDPVNTAEDPESSEPVEIVRAPSAPARDYIASIRPRSSSAGGRVSVSVYSGGASSGLTGSQDLDYSSPMASIIWKDNLSMGIPQLSAGREYDTDIKHRLPIRAGVTFTYNLTRRLGIESGLNYTILISDVREGSGNKYYDGQQKLQYIGIPLNLKYNLLSWKRFDLYASAGVLAEKCVSAKLDKQLIFNHENRGSTSENLPEKPMQWSVNASVGVQCNIVNSMSIFAEPGISHYFDDGTTLETIYKDKVLNFNLNMGLRFTFGQ